MAQVLIMRFPRCHRLIRLHPNISAQLQLSQQRSSTSYTCSFLDCLDLKPLQRTHLSQQPSLYKAGM